MIKNNFASISTIMILFLFMTNGFCSTINAEAWENIDLFFMEDSYMWSPLCIDSKNEKHNILDDLFCYKYKQIQAECQNSQTSENTFLHCVRHKTELEHKIAQANHKKRNEFFTYDVSMLPYGIKTISLEKENIKGKIRYTLIFESVNNELTLSDIFNRYGPKCGKIVADKNFNKNIVYSYDYGNCFKINNIQSIGGDKQIFFIFKNETTLSAVMWSWEGLNNNIQKDKKNTPVKTRKP